MQGYGWFSPCLPIFRRAFTPWKIFHLQNSLNSKSPTQESIGFSHFSVCLDAQTGLTGFLLRRTKCPEMAHVSRNRVTSSDLSLTLRLLICKSILWVSNVSSVVLNLGLDAISGNRAFHLCYSELEALTQL